MDKAEELLRKLQDRIKAAPPASLAPPAPMAAARSGMDPILRESHIKMIQHIRWRWGKTVQRLIDQACFGVAGIDQLGDEELVRLHRDLEQAEQCLADGVAFEDAGLIRSTIGA